jgi:nucleotide-binding universal stress UspA family protein
MIRRILVATDGHTAAAGALRMAHALSRRHGAQVAIVGVLERLQIHGIVGSETMVLAQRKMEEAGLKALERRIEAQIAMAGPDYVGWPVSVVLGSVAPTIVRASHELDADIIVLGLGRHGMADRWFGTETALRVMRMANVPVLAVPTEARELPGTAVVAVDFSAFSEEAARSALAVLRPGGELHLVHVGWRLSPETPWVGGEDWIDEHRASVRDRLTDLAGMLERDQPVRVTVHLEEGDPAREVLRLAARLEAALVAAGSHGSGFIGRVLMGSVSARLVRGAACTVLIAPPRQPGVPLADGAGGAERMAAGAAEETH